MIGRVTGIQASVSVMFRLPNQPGIEIEFVVDTGFDGALTLPIAAVATLGLPYFDQTVSKLANGEDVTTDVHVATIIWSGAERDVLVLAMNGRPLLGTALLAGHEVVIQFTDGGLVIIELL